MSPLACKQKAQPRQRGARGAARWLQRCAGTSPGLCRWGLSSSCPPPLVARGSCSSEAARRGFAGEEPCCIPSSTSPPPSTPRGLQPPGPGFPRQARSKRPGSRGRRATAELDGGGNGKPGAAPPASPLGKSSSSLLLEKANTALFFPDSANTPGNPAATQRAPAECSASSGKARGVHKRPWPNSHDSSAQGARRGPKVLSGRKGRERSLHHPVLPKERADWKSGVPTRSRGCSEAGRLRELRSTRRGGDSNRPPRGRGE